jgi:hypothetical protein
LESDHPAAIDAFDASPNRTGCCRGTSARKIRVTMIFSCLCRSFRMLLELSSGREKLIR